MADESLNFRAFGTDVSAGRMFRGLGDDADDAGDSIHGLGEQSKTLDTRLDETRTHLHALIGEFERTGDTSLFKDFGKDRRQISILEAMRKEVRGIGDDGDDVGRRLGTGVTKGLGDTLGSLPSQLKGAAIVGLVGVAAAAAPLVGAAIAGAVVGGVGLGGIIGGVALAAQDPRVKAAGTALGQNLLGDLKSAATPFIEPLLHSFSELSETGASFTADLSDGFKKLAPLLGPLTKGIDGLVHNLGPGLAAVFTAAQPALRALANELPRVGQALSDMLETISQDDRATEGLIGLLHATEGLIQATGFLIGALEWEFDLLVKIGTKLDEFKDSPFGLLASNLGLGFNILSDEATNIAEATDKAKDSTDDWDTSLRTLVDTTNAENQALKDFASSLQDQFDPMANFLHRQEDLKKAQKDLSEAIHDHGRKSDEAKAAELRLAEAILANDAAAAAAAGTFNGKFPEALRNTLKAGGLTEVQIRDLEASARNLRHELDNLQGQYTVKIKEEFYSYRAGERNPSGRASGGPVMAGQTYLVGEQGPEIVTFGANGNVIPANQSKAMMSGASGGSSLDVNVSVQSSAHARDLMAQLVLEMLRVDTAFRSAMAGYVGTAT